MTTLLLIATLSLNLQSVDWQAAQVVAECSESYELQRLNFERKQCDYEDNNWAECVTENVKLALHL